MNAAREIWSGRHRYARYVRRIGMMPRKITCMDCGGRGGVIEIVLANGSGPWYQCAWCMGTGYMLPHTWHVWMRLHRKPAVVDGVRVFTNRERPAP